MSDPAATVVKRVRSGRDRPGAPLSLTFDDGPDPDWTPRVLGALADLGLGATFFMVGEQALAHPLTARAVAGAGHEIQLHCHRHVRHSDLSEAELTLDAQRGLATLTALGARPRLWRPPWGCVTAASARVACRLGLRLVRWSVDTHDWRGDSADGMLAAIEGSLAGGGSVLMHDGLGPGVRRSGCANTLALLPKLLDAAGSLGVDIEVMR